MTVSTDARTVPFFDYPSVFKASEPDFVRIFRDVCSRGAFIRQIDLEEFEFSLASFLDAPYVRGVANATDGLHLALRAAGIGAGDEVILSSHTMMATASAIHFAGATPVPVECGTDHLICAKAVAAAVTPRTRALMPTQLNGRTSDMDALRSVAEKHHLPIVEDAAQALGSRFKGKMAGTFGVAAAISFYPAKVLGCFGDGGAIIAGDAATFDRVVSLCDYGRNQAGEVVRWVSTRGWIICRPRYSRSSSSVSIA
jgi:dTDP-4-amino-4,6-dideoxygalactose transaminase